MAVKAASTRPKLPELPDEEVVRRVLAGEKRLFEIIIRRYNQRLFRVTYSILGDPAEAEDVMQEAYVRAFEHLEQFSGRAAFATWLTKIAVYEALRRKGKAGRVEALDGYDAARRNLILVRSASSSNPEKEYLAEEMKRILEEVVSSMPATYRMVFMLREVEGLSTREAADCLDLSEEATKVRLHRARNWARDELDRLLGAARSTLFGFAGERCDRVTHAVMSRVQNSDSLSV